MATIYLVRHGQASFGADDYDRLSPLGERQAQVVGEFFAAQGVRFNAAYCGDLKRQRKTAELVLAAQEQAVPLHVDPRFNEVRNDEQVKLLAPRVMETNPDIRALMERGLSASKDYQKVIEAVFNHWVSPECDASGIQSWADYSGDVKAALAELIETQGGGKRVAVFTSGGTIATIVAQVLGLGGEHAYKFYEPVFNCSITQLFYSRRKISLSHFNDRSFLQVLGQQRGEELITYR